MADLADLAAAREIRRRAAPHDRSARCCPAPAANSVDGNEGSLFARGDVTAAATWATGWLPVLLAVVLAALIGAGYAVGTMPDISRYRRLWGGR